MMHIGGQAVLMDEEILCILNRETVRESRDTRRALGAAIGSLRLDTRAGGAERSYILCEREGETKVYASNVGALHLVLREGRS